LSHSHKVEFGAEALVMDIRDHVATALRDMEAGETIHYRVGGEPRMLALLDSVPFGHKFAIIGLEAGREVKKYGETIGRATLPIEAGRHVHVHNIEGIRGRGDQSRKGAAE
jgi:altronate dehydratase small subunit